MSTYFPVYFELSSFTYIGSIGAQHFYGQLKARDYNHPDKERIKLTYTMSAKQARRMNEIDENRVFTRYKRGDLSERFDTEADVKASALRTFEERYLPHGGVLIDGEDILNCPKVRAWPSELEERIARVNELHVQFEALGGWCQKYPIDYNARDKAHDRKIKKLTQEAYEILHGIFYPDYPPDRPPA
jgi:hypothetical protein